MNNQRSNVRRVVLLLLCLTVLAPGCKYLERRGVPAPAAPVYPRPVPVFGVDFIFQDAPHVLIRALSNPDDGARLARILKDDLGVGTIRLNSFGFYSFLGPERSVELREQTQQTNRFPWFGMDRVVDFLSTYDLRIVVGLNPEDGPEAAVKLVDIFAERGALDRIVAVELGNEPHLSKRPWQPEEYAEQCAGIIRALEPSGVRFALALTVGHETKTPTGISDNDYTRRTLAALDRIVPLAGRDDIYGAVHLYARGVDPSVIDAVNELAHPVAPKMRYLITEYNIRSSLKDNAQLTSEYGLEFCARTNRLVAHPDVAGLFVHGVPYHSVAYWCGDSGIQTVSGYRDERITGADATPGWHLTPAGKLYGLFNRHLWHGDLVAFEERGDIQIWTVHSNEGRIRIGVFNPGDSPARLTVPFGTGTIEVRIEPRSAAVIAGKDDIWRVEV